jgi:hypothetical protein
MRDYRAPIPNALERRSEKERDCDVHNFIDRPQGCLVEKS